MSDGIKAAVYELAGRSDLVEQRLWAEACCLIASGTPADEAVLAAYRVLNVSDEQSHKRVNAMQAYARNWRESMN